MEKNVKYENIIYHTSASLCYIECNKINLQFDIYVYSLKLFNYNALKNLLAFLNFFIKCK